MRQEVKSILLLSALFGLTLVTFVLTPAWGELLPPPTVRFTGAFYRLEDTKDLKGGIETLKVIIRKKDGTKELLFNVYGAENRTNPSQTGLSLLKNIFPRILTLKGSQEVLGILEKPEIAGKTIVITGFFYRRERFMVVDTVEVPGEEPH